MLGPRRSGVNVPRDPFMLIPVVSGFLVPPKPSAGGGGSRRPSAIAASLGRLRFACREVGLRSNPAAPASPSPYVQRPMYTRIHSHGLFARRRSREPKATRQLAPANFRLRSEAARSEVGARSSPRSRGEFNPGYNVFFRRDGVSHSEQSGVRPLDSQKRRGAGRFAAV
jgi:hypothetical protein